MQREKVALGVLATLAVLISVGVSEWMESKAQQLTGPYQPVVIGPTRDTNISIPAVLSASITSQVLIKASAGSLYSAVFTNSTGSAGFALLIDAAAIPNDGAVTPRDCRALPANSSVHINYMPGPPDAYSSGVVGVITSATTCYTKTSGAVSGFIKGSVQ